jgi:hypothetical protein
MLERWNGRWNDGMDAGTMERWIEGMILLLLLLLNLEFLQDKFDSNFPEYYGFLESKVREILFTPSGSKARVREIHFNPSGENLLKQQQQMLFLLLLHCFFYQRKWS